jgi:hypothetical protein
MTRWYTGEIERLASTSNTPRKEITVDLSPLLVDLKPYVEITGLYNGDSPHTRLGRSAQKGASTKEIYEVLSEAIKIEETRAATLKRNVDICAKLWPDRQPAQAFIEDGWGKNLRAVIKVKSKVAGKDDDVLFETKSDSRWKAMQQLDIIVKDYAQKRAQEDLERNEDKRRDSDGKKPPSMTGNILTVSRVFYF